MYGNFKRSLIASVLAGTVMGIQICPVLAGTNEFTDVSSGAYTVDSVVSGGSVTNYYWPAVNAISNTGADVVVTAIAGEITRSYAQSAGSLTLDGVSLVNTSNITGGSLALTNLSSYTSQSVISNAVNVNVGAGSALIVGTGGNVSLNAADTLTGILSQTDGVLNLNGVTSNGTITSAGGTFNVGTTTASTLNMAAGSSIAAATTTNLDAGSTIGISGGTVSFNAGDTWDGAVNQSAGTLNYDGLASNGALTSTGGNLNIGTTSPAALDVTVGSSIGAATTTNLASGSAITITGGNVSLNAGDTWAGAVSQTSGTLNYDGLVSNGALSSTGGNLNIGTTSAATLTVAGGSLIDGATTVNLASGSTINNTGGDISFNSGDTWAGAINQSFGSLNYDGLYSNGALTLTGGTISIGANESGYLAIAAGSSIDSIAVVNLSLGSGLGVEGGDVTLSGNDLIAGDLNLYSGNLTLDSVGTLMRTSSGTYNQNGGVLTINNAGLNVGISGGAIFGGEVSLTNVGSLTLRNGLDTNQAVISTDNSANNLIIGDGTSATGLTLNEGSFVDANTNLTINTNSTLYMTRGNDTDTVTVNVNTGDIWSGTINLGNQDATLNYNGLVTNGTLIATDGNLNIGTTNASTLNIAVGSSIASNVVTYLGSGSSININGGTVNLNTGDTWAGTITQSLGTLNYDNLSSNGIITTTGGNLNIGTFADATLDIATGSTIGEGSTVNLASGSTITLNGGTVNMNAGDTWSGTISQTLGTLNYDGLASNGLLVANQGNLNIGTVSAATLNIAGGSSIASAVATNIATGSTLALSGGTVNLNTGDTWAGTVSMSSGTLNYDQLSSNGILTTTGGNLNIGSTSAATLNIAAGSSIAAATVANLASGSTLNVSGGTVNLNTGDTWAGTLNHSSGTLNYDGLASNGTLASTGGNLNIGSTSAATLNIASGSSIAAATTTNIASGSTLAVSGGTVSLNAGDTWTGTVNQTSGTLNYDGLAANGALTAAGGNLNIGTTSAATLNVASGSSIDSTTNVNLAAGSTLALSGNGATPASVTLNSNASDNWAGRVYLQNVDPSTPTNAQLTLNNGYNHTTTATSTYTQESGTLNVDGVGSGLTLGTSASVISGGNVNLTNQGSININNGSANTASVVANDATATTLGLSNAGTSLTLSSGSTIGNSTQLSIGNGTALSLANSATTVNMNTGDTWAGTVNLNNTGATLNYNGLESNGVINAQAGNLNIGTSSAATMTVGAGSQIANTAKTNLASGSTLNIQGTSAANTGAVTFNGTNVGADDIDIWSGNVNVSDHGSLTLNAYSHTAGAATAKYAQTGGTLNLSNGSSLTLGNVATNSVKTGTNTQSIINVSGGSSIIFSNGTANEAVVNSNDGNINTITLSELANSATSLKVTGGTIDANTNVNINENTTLEISRNNAYLTTALVTLDGTDNCDGDVSLTGGNLVLNNASIATVPAATNGVHYYQTSGESALENGSMVAIYDGSAISGGSMLIDNTSALGISTNGMTLSGDLITSGAIATINGLYQNQTIGNNLVINNSSYTDKAGNVITGDGTADFYVDLYARDNATGKYSSDKFTIAGVVTTTDLSSPAVININNWALNGDLYGSGAPQDQSYDFKVFDAAGYASNIIWANVSKSFDTAIGAYKLIPTGQGSYRLALASFNDATFRGQVSTVAQYANQLQVNNLLFDHAGLVNHADLAAASAYANKYAIQYPQFAPYEYTKERGGLWYKTYGNFENISMSQNIKTRNYAYGSVFGVDLPQTNLGRNWKYLSTVYGAYNFGHQLYSNNSMYQNGAQLGLMNTLTNNRYIGSLLTYIGGYGNAMTTPNGVIDEAGTWFGGIAQKSSYNINLTRNLYLQPTLMLSYNMFGRQNWHSAYGDMSMSSAALNGLNVAPGLNLIWDKEKLSLYATSQYVFNVVGGAEGMAGNVPLPNMKMDNFYLEYGLGIKREVGDRFSLYTQGVGRVGTRLGGAVQGGLEWRM